MILCFKEIIQISHSELLETPPLFEGLEKSIKCDKNQIHLQLTKLCPSLWTKRPTPHLSKWKLTIQPIVPAH